jgi:hypothetical protein
VSKAVAGKAQEPTKVSKAAPAAKPVAIKAPVTKPVAAKRGRPGRPPKAAKAEGDVDASRRPSVAVDGRVIKNFLSSCPRGHSPQRNSRPARPA